MSLSQHISTRVLKRSAVDCVLFRCAEAGRLMAFNPSSLEVVCENVESLHIRDVCDFAA